ncbi:MAG: radical SAM protein, partial [Myxococcales bacterium]
MATSERRALPLAVRRHDPEFIPREMVSARNVLVSFGFECNFACRFCMVEDALGSRRGLSLAALRAFVADGQTMRGVERIVLSGGEVTLDDALLDYVAAARQAPGVRHVRLQTNGTRLASPRLVDAGRDQGVDEFFVSLHGATAATCDDLTRVKGSFRAILRGMETIAARPARLLVNTCIVEPNHRELPALVDLVAPLRPAGLDFWNLWPRLDPHDERRLQARVQDVRPSLIAALDRADQLGVRSVVKWFPRCLLDHHAAKQDNQQPTVLIHETYWEEAPDFSCLYGSICQHGQDRPCAGLSHAYVRRFGWEEDTLRPSRAAPAAAPPGETAAGLSPQVARWLGSLGLRPGQLLGEARLVGAAASEGLLVLQLAGEAGAFELRVAPRSPQRPAFVTTARFGVTYAPSGAGTDASAIAA